MMALLFAIGVSLLSADAGRTQAVSTTPSRELQQHLKQERFDVVSSIRGLPLGVRAAMITLFDSREFDVQRDIAQPGERFQGADAIKDPSLPLRRLIAAECSLDHCLIYYERGGSRLTFHVALFHWMPEATRFEAGGLAPKRLETIADVRSALLSGALKDSAKLW
jgi:hypothetical protein